jgi:hypothetical protein
MTTTTSSATENQRKAIGVVDELAILFAAH